MSEEKSVKLYAAVTVGGNGSEVRSLIRSGADVNWKHESGSSVLENGCTVCWSSIHSKSVEELEVLLEQWRDTLRPLLEKNVDFDYVTLVQWNRLGEDGEPVWRRRVVDEVLSALGFIASVRGSARRRACT